MVGPAKQDVSTSRRRTDGSSPAARQALRGEEILRLEGVSRRPLLHDLDLRVCRGEILGIAGIAGAGRTETARIMVGADHADSGKLFVRSEEARIRSPRAARRYGITYVPEERKSLAILGDFPVSKNITISDLGRICRAKVLLRRRYEVGVTSRYVNDLGIKAHSVRQSIGTLSGGNQQKAVIARCLFTDPDLIIFDEPTQGIDVGAKAEVYRLVYEFVDRGGAAIVISSELPELIRLSDRICVMADGRVVGEVEGTGRDEVAAEDSEIGERILGLATRGRAA